MPPQYIIRWGFLSALPWEKSMKMIDFFHGMPYIFKHPQG